MRRITPHIVLALALIAFSARAQVSFKADAPGSVAVGDQFQVAFTLSNANGSNFNPPQVGGAKLLYGPAISQSYSSQTINGHTSSASSVRYIMTYRAQNAGKYQVGSASIVVNGKTMTTKPFSITITESGQNHSQQRQSQGVQLNDPTTKETGTPVSTSDLFVRITLSKDKVYEQEAVVCTIKLYTKYEIQQFYPTLQPSFDGFLIEELPVSPYLNKIENVNGQSYMTAELKKCILYPQQSGRLTITSGNYDVNVIQYDIYDTPFGSMQRGQASRTLKVESNSVSVQIQPLPSPRPDNFCGAVGQFTLLSSLNPETPKSFSSATYSLELTGTGNLKYIKAPEIKIPTEFESYEPQTDINAEPYGNNISGTTTFNYTFVPQSIGTFEIPATTLSYFDPEKGEYLTLHVPATPVKVEKGSQPEGGDAGGDGEMVDILDIAEGDLNLAENHPMFVDRLGYWLWFIIPALLLAMALVVYRRLLKQRSNASLMRIKRASKVAQRRLKQARQAMQRNDRNAFYASTLSATWGYLSDKLGIPVSELSKDNIAAELEAYGADEDLRQKTLDLLDKCEFAQYAPELADTDMKQVLNEAAGIMDDLETTKPRTGMTRDIITTLLLLLAGTVGAQADSLAEQANEAYQNEAYREAFNLYQQAREQDGTSAELMYNMGNTLLRMNDTCQAIIHYERALRLDPSMSEARANLRFLREKANVEDNTRPLLNSMLDRLVARHTSNTWAVWAAVTFCLTLIAIALYAFTTNMTLRKTGFFAGIAMLVICIISVISAFYVRSRMTATDEAIVTATPRATLSTSARAPKNNNEVAFQLKWGTKVVITDSVQDKRDNQVDTWYEVDAGNGTRAWMNAKDLEKI